MLATLVAICALSVLGICIALIFDRDYEDGLIGRIGLSILGLGAFSRFADFIELGVNMRVSGAGIMVWLGLLLFMGRHLYRFRCWRSKGRHDWRDADRSMLGGKRSQA